MTPKRTRLLKRAALWLVLLGPFFYASYGLANWWAGTRAQVPSVVFAWEQHIPFLAWTIFPYWSLNLFYAASLLLGTSLPSSLNLPTTLALVLPVARMLAEAALTMRCGVLVVSGAYTQPSDAS